MPCGGRRIEEYSSYGTISSPMDLFSELLWVIHTRYKVSNLVVYSVIVIYLFVDSSFVGSVGIKGL